MTTLAPINDGQLIRSFNERIRDLEHRSTLRLGDWVIKAATDGELTAIKPGAERVVLSQVADYTKVIQEAVVAAITKGGYVSAVDLASALMGLSAVTGTTPDTILAEITRWAEGLATGWNDALRLVGAATPSALLQLLAGLFPAAKTAIDGSLHALNIDGFVQNAEGTWSYIAQQGENGLSRLIQQADGTIINASHAVYQMATGAALAGAPLGQAVASGQQLVDHGIAAIEGEAIALGQSAQAHAAAMTAMFTSWVNAWSGQLLPTAASPEITAAALQAAQQQAAQAALTASINGQLPHFYGGHGTAGTNVAETSFGSGLPATFTIVPTIARIAARHNTPCTNDSQTVSAVWSAADQFPKYLFLRMSVDGTSYVYVKLANDLPNAAGVGYDSKAEIGCVVGGVKTVWQTFAINTGFAAKLQASAGYTFEATDYAFIITGPNLSVSYTDVSHTSQKGPLYVYGGFGHDGVALGAAAIVPTNVFTVPSTMVAGQFLDMMVAGGCSTNAGSFNNRTLTVGSDVLPSDVVNFTFAVNGPTVVDMPGSYPDFIVPAGNGTGVDTFDYTFFLQTGNTHGTALFAPWKLDMPGAIADFNLYDSGPGVGPAAAYVATSELCTSSTYVNLTTVTDEITITVGPSGLVIVFISATGIYSSGTGWVALISFSMSGANAAAATDDYATLVDLSNANPSQSGLMFLVPDLNPGATTFKLQYRITGAGGCSFAKRRIAGIPL